MSRQAFCSGSGRRKQPSRGRREMGGSPFGRAVCVPLDQVVGCFLGLGARSRDRSLAFLAGTGGRALLQLPALPRRPGSPGSRSTRTRQLLVASALAAAGDATDAPGAATRVAETLPPFGGEMFPWGFLRHVLTRSTRISRERGQAVCSSPARFHCFLGGRGEEFPWQHLTSEGGNPTQGTGKSLVGAHCREVYCGSALQGNLLWELIAGKSIVGSHCREIYCGSALQGNLLRERIAGKFIVGALHAGR